MNGMKVHHANNNDLPYENMLNTNPMIYGTPGSRRREIAEALVETSQMWHRELVDGVHPDGYLLIEWLFDMALACTGAPCPDVLLVTLISMVESTMDDSMNDSMND